MIAGSRASAGVAERVGLGGTGASPRSRSTGEARLGRTFTPDEDKPGTHVVVLSDGIWKRRFGSNPAIVGQAIVLNGQSYTVVISLK